MERPFECIFRMWRATMHNDRIRWLFVDDWSARIHEDVAPGIDNASTRLEHMGVPAQSALEAVRRVEEHPPDVVLLDVRLVREQRDVGRQDGSPDVGCWCAEEIRRLAPNTKIILIST